MNRASCRHPFLVFSLLGLSALGPPALAKAAGDLNYQEKGDLQWRQLQIPADDHGAVYDEFTAGNPLDKNTHNLVEMEGPALQIRSLTLQQFIDTPGDFYGGYSYPLTVLGREARQEIVRLARTMRDYRNPFTGQRIQYVESAAFDYIVFVDRDGDGLLDLDDIDRMRSDAFTEFCYATLGHPIVTINGQTMITDPALFEARASAVSNKLVPSTQRMAMLSAIIENPVVEVRDTQGAVINGGASNTRSISVNVDDFLSGPGRLELWQGIPFSGGTLLAVNNVHFDAVRHTYTAADTGLGVFANLPEGQLTIRAIDQAGNVGSESEVRFEVSAKAALPAISMSDVMFQGYAPNVYESFKGVSSAIPSTVVPSFAFGGSQRLFVSVEDPAGLASISAPGLSLFPPLTPNTTSYTGFLALPLDTKGVRPPIRPGMYTLTAKNSNQRSSVAPVRVAGMGASITSLSGTFDRNTHDYTWTITLALTSTLGLNRIERLARATGNDPGERLVEVRSVSGGAASVTYTASGRETGGLAGALDAMIFDVDGNCIRFAYFVFPESIVSGKPGSAFVGPISGTQFATGSYLGRTVPLGAGVTITDLVTDGNWNIDLALGPPIRAPSGWKTSGSASYLILQEHASPTLPTLSIPFDSTGLSAAQISKARLGRRTSGTEQMGVDVMATSRTTDALTVKTLLNGAYTPIVPSYENPEINAVGDGAELLYDGTANVAVSFGLASPSDPVAVDLLAQASLLGYNLQGSLYLAGPHGTSFIPPAYITLPRPEMNRDQTIIVELSEGLVPRTLPNQDRDNPKKITAPIDRINSYFGLFMVGGGGSGGVGVPDLSPPVTTLRFGGFFASTAGAAGIINEISAVTLQAVDSGVGQVRTYYAVDPSSSVIFGGLNPATTGAFTVYANPFPLIPGRRVVAYGSVDGSGNYEVLRATEVVVESSAISASDITPPVTALGFSGFFASTAGAAGIINESSSITLTAIDSGAGPVRTFYMVDPASAILSAGLNAGTTGTFTAYGGAFSLIPGQRAVAYGSVDGAGNYETLQSTMILVRRQPSVDPAEPDDLLPPRTSFSAGTFQVIGPTVFVSRALGFTVADDGIVIGDGLGVGATQTFYAADGTAYSRVTNSFFLVAEGTHTVSFFSVDRKGNTEQAQFRSLSVDLTPPQSALSSNGVIYSIDTIDLPVAGARSGVAEVLYWVDVNPGNCAGVVLDTGAARGTCANPTYAGPFPLAAGLHTVYFQAIDAVGNREFLHADNVKASNPDAASFGGLGIGRDPFDAFWSVVSVNDALSFARADSRGALISSTSLLDVAFGLPWSVFFDAAGRAYAVGLAEGLSTRGTDVAVYKAAAAGDAIEARILFDSGYGNNDLVLDAKAPGWLVGAAQTSGPVNLDLYGERNFALALWKFDPALGAVALSTTFARGAFDVGTGVAVDADGSLWIAGYSRHPDAPAVRGFDLTLWHYAANGKTLLGGPFLWPGYLSDFDGSITARVHVSGGSVYIAAPRENAAGFTDLAFLRFDKATSRATSESVWRAGDGSASYPATILPEAAGLLVAGGIGAGEPQAALWRFGFDGALRGAALAGAGGARGAVFKGSELWLSVDASTAPYRVQTETPALGGLVDLMLARTTLLAGEPSAAVGSTLYVTSASLLGFNAADDKLAPGDGLGVGATQTYYATDAGGYARFASSFSLIVEGLHSVSFFSVDREGNAEARNVRSVGVDLTPPGVALVSSGTLFTINAVDPVVAGAASGVAELLYLIDVDPAGCEGVVPDTRAARGTCANDLYAGPFEIAPGTHTIWFLAVDRVGNESALMSQPVAVASDIKETGQARFAFFFGSQGSAPGQFVGTVFDVAVDHLGAVYASDFFGSKINKYDADGRFLLSWGEPGSGPGQFGRGSHGITIAVDPHKNHVLATDPLYPRVQIFTSTGGFLGQIGPALAGSAHTLSGPSGAACDKAGNVYIADLRAGRIFKTDHDGNFLKTWLIPPLPATPADPAWHIRVGGDDSVYVTGGSWVLKFSPEGDLLQRFGQRGIGSAGSFINTIGLDFDAANNLYATDNQCQPSHCVVVFDPSGGVLSSFGTSSAGPGQILASYGLAVNKNSGRIYVADTFNNRIGVWDVVVPTNDIRAPITALTPVGPTTSLSDGSLVVSPATPISFAATDVASPGLAPSGVARTEYRLDGGALTVFTAPFTLSEVFNSLGDRLLEFRSIDKAGNVEVFQSRQVRVDSLAPNSAAYVDGIQMTNLDGVSAPLPDGVVTTAGRLTFVASDRGRQVTAGINSVLVTLDGAAVALSTSSLRPWDGANDRIFASFDLAVPLREGPHTLSWRSTDLVGLAEQTRTLSFAAAPAPLDPVDIRAFRNAATIVPGLLASDIAVDALGNVYAASLGADDVRKFSPDGTSLAAFFLAGKDGIGVGISPTNVIGDVGETRKLLAAKGKTVVMFRTEELFVGRFAGELAGFANAVDAVFDGQGAIYVADAGARRISVFGQGEFTPRALIGQGLFADGPYRIAIGRNGVIYATDRGPARVLKFSARGELLGELKGPLNQADGLGVDLYGNVYVSDKVDNLVHVFSSTGGLLTQFGGAGSGPGQLLNPAGLAVHLNSGRVYVADNGNSRIQVFALDPPPAAVEDLSAAAASGAEVLLRWTAPGDDATRGRAATYDLRRATAPILTSSAFLNAMPVPGLAVPQPAGSPESFLAAGLPGGATLYFALRTTDSGRGVSSLSNSAAIRLPFLARSTAAVDGKPELAFSIPGVQPSAALLSSATTAGAVVLGSASAQGLAAVSSIYDLAPEGVLFDPPGVLTMHYSTRTLAQLGLSEADVALYRFDSRLGWVRVFGQIIDMDRKVVTVSLDSIASIFAVLAVVRDDVPPITTLQTFGGSAFIAAAGGLYVSSSTSFGFSSFDPLKLGTASGIDFTEFRIDAATPGAPFQTFAMPFKLAEGKHRIDFRSRDKARNVEPTKSSAVTVDASAPALVLHSPLGGEAFVAGQSSISVRVSAADNFDPSPRFEAFLVQLEDRGSPRGDRPSRVAVNSEQVIQPLEIDDGLWALEVKAEDFVGNSTVAVSRPFEVIHDIRPPRTSASIGEPRFIVAGSTYVTGHTPLSLPAVDDLLVAGDGIGLGVRKALFAVDADSFSVLTGSMTISAEGPHAWKFFSVDVVGNTESTQTVKVRVDDTAPVSTITIGAPLFIGTNGTLFVSSATRFTLSVVDPGVQGAASGLKDTVLSIDAGAFEVSSGAFTLSPRDGLRELRFFSRDNLLNAELVRGAAVALDNTPPVTAVQLGMPMFVAVDSINYITPATPVTFTASDPAVSGIASGVNRIEVSVDGGAFTAYTSALTFVEGRHTILYRAVDNVANFEAARRLDLQSDNTPPATVFTPSGMLFTVGERSYAAAQFTYALPARDPVAGNVASGVAFTRHRTTPGAYQNFASAFSLSEGVRRVEFQSQDNVGNLELLKSATVFVDATSPISALAIGNPKFDPGNGLPVFVAAATPLTLSALDPEVQEVASGVRQISFRRGSDAFGAYAAPFTLPLPDGLKMADFFAADNVGNVESARSASVALDNTAPATSLAVLGGRQFPGPNATSFYASSDTRLALLAVDPSVNGVASGLALTQWQDNGGAFQAFTAAFALPEGAHALGYQSQDRVQNVEVSRSTTVLIDAAPPVATAHIGAPSFVSVEGTNYITPATPVTFTAVDPILQGVASGVSRIEVAVDGGPFTAYYSALAFAEGRHTILYRAIDNVANVESVRTLSVQSDATPPASSLAIGAPSFDPGAGQPVIVAAATLLTLSAQDLVVMDVAAGVREISFRRGGDPFRTYAAPFTLQLPDGLKTLDYFATDNVGNQEAARSTTVALDNTPPLTTLAVLGGRQFPGPDAASFYASSDTRFALPAADPVVGGVASGLALTQWQDNSGAFQAFAIAFGLPEGRHLIAYQSQDRIQNMEVPRSTTVLVDAAAPVSSATIGSPLFVAADGTNYITPATPVRLSAADPSLPTGQPGSGVSRIEVAIDGGNFSSYSSALTFAEGRHTILYRAVDNVGNVEVVHALQVRSDATPPVSSLVIGEPRFQLPTGLLVSTRTPFSIAPVDPIVNNVASGVKDTSFRVSDLAPGSGAFLSLAAPFTMAGADVSKVIEFFSRDNVLTAEVVRSSTVLLDSTPPEVALLSPASCGAGICRVFKGKFPVLGAARDAHFANYQLEFAPGQDAATGFALISSGALAVSSGSLGTWDATALSGWLTVRLTAADLVANTASVSLNVFVGDPSQSLILGNHEVFDMPEGVAVDGNGKIYVADRNNDRIAVFSSTGALLASLGGRKDDDDDEDEDDDKHKKSTATLRLNKPSGVAVDAAGNIYVADTNGDRVLKLSSAGQVLLSLGRRERHDEDERARALPGQFQHPAGVALDAATNIYVADTGNRRVQVFSSTGAFNFQFSLPPVPARLDDDDDGEDDEGRVQPGKPSGIAIDAAGHIYVADSKGGRALKFGAAGQLLLTIPIPGEKPGRLGQPFGVAVSSNGDCLLVSDRKSSRILKFDFLGNSNLVFGGKGKIKDDDDAPVVRSAIVFKKPMGLALDSQGNLFVADRNNNRIQKLGLPTGQAPLVVPPPKPGEEHIARDVVDTEDGGKVERGDRAAVDIPAGAVALDLKISVSTPAFSVADDSNRRRAAEDARLKTASPPVEYGPEGTKFKGEVTLTLPYSPDLVALQKIDAKDLLVRYWNREKTKWEDLESVVDPKTRTVKAKTTHFSLYQVFSGTVSAAAISPLVADAAFIFHDAYAFPNPVRGAGAVTIRMQTGLADSVEVRVYDVSGRKIHSSSNFSLNPSLDDGNGKGEQFTYDHVWDVSGVGSGVYQYVITAKKAGHADIHKTGRIGAVK